MNEKFNQEDKVNQAAQNSNLQSYDYNQQIPSESQPFNPIP